MATCDTQHLCLGLLITAVVLVSLGIATGYWSCGNLFENCIHLRGSEYNGSLAMIILSILGLTLLAVVLLMDLLGLCIGNIRTSYAILQVRTVLLFLGVILLIIGLLVFTAMVMPIWSYLATTIGATLALQVAILTAMMCSCTTTTSSSSRVVHVTRTVHH